MNPAKAASPQSGPVYAGVAQLSMERQDQRPLRENENVRGDPRFLQVQMFQSPPLARTLRFSANSDPAESDTAKLDEAGLRGALKEWEFDFASDEKRTKVVAREMMRMVGAINERLDSLPGRPTPLLNVTCGTCHRGVSRPVPLSNIIEETTVTAIDVDGDGVIDVVETVRVTGVDVNGDGELDDDEITVEASVAVRDDLADEA